MVGRGVEKRRTDSNEGWLTSRKSREISTGANRFRVRRGEEWPHRQVLHGLVHGHPQGIGGVIWPYQLLQRQESLSLARSSKPAERTIPLAVCSRGG